MEEKIRTIMNKHVQERLLGELAHFRESVTLYTFDEKIRKEVLIGVDAIAELIKPDLFEEEKK
jgi:hypothetical protein